MNGVQLGGAYLEEIKDEQAEGVFRTRVIRPVLSRLMVRFDVVVDVRYSSVSIENVLWYQRGDEYSEARALEGDRA